MLHRIGGCLGKGGGGNGGGQRNNGQKKSSSNGMVVNVGSDARSDVLRWGSPEKRALTPARGGRKSPNRVCGKVGALRIVQTLTNGDMVKWKRKTMEWVLRSVYEDLKKTNELQKKNKRAR